MNRIYSLVWNRALQALQVASELTRGSVGVGNAGAGRCRLRQRPLALACVAVLSLGAFALPAWSATCPAGASPIGSATGAAGTTLNDGSGTDGGTAAGGPSGSYLCLVGGVVGGAGGYGASTGGLGGSGGAGFVGGGFNLVNNGYISGGKGGAGYDGDVAGSGGDGIVATGAYATTITNNTMIRGGGGGIGVYAQGGTGGNAISGNNITVNNSNAVFGGAGGYGFHGSGGDGGDAITGAYITVTNTAGGIFGGHGGSAFYTGTGGNGGDGINGDNLTVANSSQIGGGGGGNGVEGGAGGNGGTGIVASGTATITNEAAGYNVPGGYIAGGIGGAASTGAGGTFGVGGTGGAGISGSTFTGGASSDFTLNNVGGVVGGNGGIALNATGGNGGAGVSGAGINVTNSGNLIGGDGGYSLYTTTGTGLGAGSGGAALTGEDFTFDNSGRVLGGYGNVVQAQVKSAATVSADTSLTGGTGGAGVSGSGFTVTNHGGAIDAGWGSQAGFDSLATVVSTGGDVTGNISVTGGASGSGITGINFTVNNEAGYILGGAGSAADAGAQSYSGSVTGTIAATGGTGGSGVLGTGFTLSNAAAIDGGFGGRAQAAVSSYSGGGSRAIGTGGSGGIGVGGDAFSLTNTGYVQGGFGGAGYASALGGLHGGYYLAQGGDGGAGVASNQSNLTNHGLLKGGAAGVGYLALSGVAGAVTGPAGEYRAVGGAGGVGVSGNGVGYSFTNGADVVGGAGAITIAKVDYVGSGSVSSAGGAGGAGVSASNGFMVTNSGNVDGGHGGYGSATLMTESASGFGSISGTGGIGGAGVFGTSITLNNGATGKIVGGAGGLAKSVATIETQGAYYSLVTQSETVGGVGGVGGAGVAGDALAFTNHGSVVGGMGGLAVGGDPAATGATQGAPAFIVSGLVAGAGGAGMSIADSSATASTVTNAVGGTVTGGAGGYAVATYLGVASGYFQKHVVVTGSAGGNGFSVTGNGSTEIGNDGSIAGGAGNAGYAGVAMTTTSAAGATAGAVTGISSTDGLGGVGGSGVAGTGFALANRGSISGGAGGAGGYGGFVRGSNLDGSITGSTVGLLDGEGTYSGAGGNGGAGINGSAFTLTNTGTIVGGNGGVANPAGGGAEGAGGVGVSATGGANVSTAGLIAGGLSGDGTVRADAIDFSGGGNTLSLASGYAFQGNVVSSSGTTNGGDTLILGGTADDSFDAAQIIASAPVAATGATAYFGFAHYAKTGSSTWTLSGTTAAVTPWTLDGGVLSVTSDGSLGATSGAVTFNGGTLQNTAAINTSRALTIGTAGGSLNTVASLTDSGAITGAGVLTKSGAGALTVNGDGAAFTGTTTISAGELVVGDDNHAGASLGGMVNVAQGATLAGIGTIGGMDLSGTLSPGGSIGTLHVSGNATFEPGSTFSVEANPAGQADQLAVGGSVTIKGGNTLVIASSGNWAPRTQYTIITAGSGVTGAFNSVSDNQAFLNPALSYQTHAVNLSLERNDISFQSVAGSANAGGVAGAADSLGWGNPVYDALVVLDAADAQVAFNQLSGEYHASQETARINDSRFIREAMNQRLRAGDNDAEATQVGSLTAWAHAWGHWDTTGANGGAARLADNGDGLLVGADMPVGTQGRVGVTGGASRDSLSIDARNSWGRETSTWLGAFAGYTAGAFGLRGGVAYAWDQIPVNREIAFPGFSDRISSNATGKTLTGFIEGAWTLQFAHGSAAPFVNLAHTRVTTEASTETGGAAALAASAGTDNVSFSTVGVRGRFNFAHDLNVHGELGWQHAYGDITPSRSLRFVAAGPSFTEFGVPVAQNAGIGRVGLGWQTGNVAINADYEGLAGGGVKDQAAKLSFSVTF